LKPQVLQFSFASGGHSSSRMPPTHFSKLHTVQNINTDEVLSLTDDLIRVIDSAKDGTALTETQEEVSRFQSAVDEDWSQVQILLKEIQENVLACERKVKAAEEEGVDDEKLEAVRRELKEELQNEQILNRELRKIEDEMNRLEVQRVNIENHKKVLKDAITEDIRARSTISLYASITKIIPDLNEKERVKGYIVDRDRSKMERFEFDQTTMSNAEICNRLWNMGDTIQRH